MAPLVSTTAEPLALSVPILKLPVTTARSWPPMIVVVNRPGHRDRLAVVQGAGELAAAFEAQERGVGGDAVPHDRAVEAHGVGALRDVEHAHERGLVGGQRERAVGLVDDEVAERCRCPRTRRPSRVALPSSFTVPLQVDLLAAGLGADEVGRDVGLGRDQRAGLVEGDVDDAAGGAGADLDGAADGGGRRPWRGGANGRLAPVTVMSPILAELAAAVSGSDGTPLVTFSVPVNTTGDVVMPGIVRPVDDEVHRPVVEVGQRADEPDGRRDARQAHGDVAPEGDAVRRRSRRTAPGPTGCRAPARRRRSRRR